MGLFRQIFGIHRKAAVAHAVHVEQLVVDGQHLAEVGVPALEFQVPYFHRVFQAEFLALDFRESGQHVRTTEQNLTFVADTRANEQVFGDVHKVIISDDGAVLVCIPYADFDVLTGHVPQSAGEPCQHTVLAHVLDFVLHAEQVAVFHSKAHVVNAVLLDVGEAPVHFFLGNLVKC